MHSAHNLQETNSTTSVFCRARSAPLKLREPVYYAIVKQVRKNIGSLVAEIIYNAIHEDDFARPQSTINLVT